MILSFQLFAYFQIITMRENPTSNQLLYTYLLRQYNIKFLSEILLGYLLNTLFEDINLSRSAQNYSIQTSFFFILNSPLTITDKKITIHMHQFTILSFEKLVSLWKIA